MRTRDEQVFRTLYRRHTPVLYRVALRFLDGDENAAQEAVHEAWICAVDGLGGFRWESSLRTWLTGIAINQSRQHRRRAARQPGPLPDILPGRENTAIVGDRIDLERAIAQLPDGYRDVFMLYDVEGYSHTEISGLLGIAVGTCKSQLSRARHAMRRLLAAPAINGSHVFKERTL